MSGRRLRAVRARIAVVSFCALLAESAEAATFTVVNTDDMGAGSLRQAILDANASLDATDTIVFDLPTDSTITLDSSLAPLEGDVTVDATGAPNLTVDGGIFSILETDGGDVTWIDLETDAGTMAIADGQTLTFTANNAYEVESDISDAGTPTTGGAVVKDGTETLTLTGNNSFTGGLTIEEGTLIGDTDSIPGDVANEGALVFQQADDESFAGVVSGSDSLEKRGVGNLTLDGDNTYTGGTTVTEGTLTGDTMSLQGDVVNEASLVFDQTLDGTFAGAISGDGSVTKDGAGNLTLTGANSYTGGTTVDGGTLTGDASAIQGDVALASGTALVFDEDGSGTHGGAISGDGALEKTGIGSVRLNGPNTYIGGTTVSEGTLVVDTTSLPAAGGTSVAAGATLAFDQAGSGVFDGVIDGAGDVEKRGAGTLTLTMHQTYTGTTTIESGVLELSGSLVSATTVNAGGTLAGNGLISAPVVVHGTLSPGGASIDTFDVTGSVDFTAGSTLVVDVDPGGTADRLDASGAVSVDPTASLEVRPAPGDYSGGTTVTVLDGGSLTGTFLEGEPFAFLDRIVSYPGGGMVEVTLMANGANLATIGQTPNQRAVGTALSTLVGSVDPDLVDLFDNLNTLTASQAAPTLDALSGESLTAGTTARAALAERTQRSLHRRMRSVLFEPAEAWPAAPQRRGRSTRPTRRPLGRTDVAAPPRLGERGVGPWIDAFGVIGSLDGDGNAGEVDYRFAGATAGVDFRLGDQVLAGAAAGYARTSADVDDRDGDTDLDTAQGAAYLAWANRRFYAGVSGRYGWSDGESRRTLVVGSLARSARADFDSHDYGVRGELALRAFEAGPVAFEPQAGFEWGHLSRDGFRERGAGTLGLDVDSEDLDTALLQLGGRLSALFEMEEAVVLAPELRAYWLREFGDDTRELEATLAGAPLRIQGAEAPNDALLVGAGWSIAVGGALKLSAEYDLRLDADRSEHMGTLALRVRF